jgi:hypothetical protein
MLKQKRSSGQAASHNDVKEAEFNVEWKNYIRRSLQIIKI